MKRTRLILLLLLLLSAGAGLTYWQLNKKKIIRNKIEKAVKKETDSLYYIKYDSSRIDELGGNAIFYNVSLQSDSAQKELLTSTDSLPNALYNIKIAEVKAAGIDVVGLLQSQNISASSIVLTRPVIQIVNTGVDQPNDFTQQDTLEIYKKILGNFKSIKAGNIKVVDGSFIILNRKGKPLTTIEKINVDLDDFLVDEQHDYTNIISYFVKNVKVTAENIQLPESRHNHRINISKLEYDAAQRTLHINELQQYEVNNSTPLINLANIHINQLNNSAFILNQQLKAGMITCEGGLVTITRRKSSNNPGNRRIEMFPDFIEQAQVEGLNIGKTKLVLIDSTGDNGKPLVFNDVRFIVSKVERITEGTTIGNIIANSQWQLFSSGFSMVTKDKLYRIITGGIKLDNSRATISIGSIAIKPLLSETDFVKQSVHQKDQYNLLFNNINLAGVNFKELADNNSIVAENGSMQAIMKIFNDRTLPPDTSSKVGNYPHQMLLALDIPVYIGKLKVNNSHVSYRERSVLSAEVGNTFFSNISASFSNITNIPAKIQQNAVCRMDATAFLLGKALLSTRWDLKLNSKQGEFAIQGKLATMDGTDLNVISEPLALLGVKEGFINKTEFSMTGDDYHSKGNIDFLYDGIKVAVLKKTADEDIKKKKAASLFANFIILNSNPRNGTTRKVNINLQRDIQRSFFNLIWKSVFDAAQRIATGKK